MQGKMIKHLLLEREEVICIIYAVFSTIISDIPDRFFSLFLPFFLYLHQFSISNKYNTISSTLCFYLQFFFLFKSWILNISQHKALWQLSIRFNCVPIFFSLKRNKMNEYLRFDFRRGRKKKKESSL